MQQTFDLRLATLAANYRNGNTTPRALLAAIRQRAETLNPEFNLFIHLLSEAEQAPFLAALEGIRQRRFRCTACRSRSKTILTLRRSSRPLPARRLHTGRRKARPLSRS
ncbi:allophanate hydrolase [Klebsiella variicola]|nr:allophanate hydrolase [Klebsiella variicola]